MYIYDEEDYKPKKVRILDVLSAFFYVFGAVALALAGFLNGELDPRWALIPISLFVFATFLKPVVTRKSWKAVACLIMASYYCFTFVLSTFRPDLSNRLFLITNSLLGWAFIITLFIGLIIGARKKFKRRVS